MSTAQADKLLYAAVSSYISAARGEGAESIDIANHICSVVDTVSNGSVYIILNTKKDDNNEIYGK